VKTYFISGHRTPTDLARVYYREQILALEFEECSVVVGDYYGIDAYAQGLMYSVNENRVASGKEPIPVTVYHMFDDPRNNSAGFPTKGGFTSDHERDSAMTLDSDEDIAFVDAGREGSGTHQNIVRRHVMSVTKNLSKSQAKEFTNSFIYLLRDRE